MSNLNLGRDLYIKGRIGWQGLNKDEYLTKSDYKIINATALMDGYINWDNCGYISKERYNEAKEIQLQEGDILISKDGTLGKIGYVKGLSKPCSVASGIFVLRNTAKDKVDFDYLYHLLKSHIFKDFIRRNKALGSTISHLYQRDLENFDLELPSVENQRKIASFLNIIDSKIELNQKISALLEEQAKTIYDYWFTQFDFPDENGKPYKSSGGKMVWSEELKREIPEGWEVNHFDEVFKITMGCSPNGDSINEKREGMPFFQGKTDFGLRFPTVRTFTTSSLRQALYGDTLLSVRAPVGALNRAIEDCSIGRGIASIRLYKYPSFTYYTCLAMRKFFEIYDAGGTTFGCIGKDNLHSILCVVPPKEIIQNYEKLATSADQCIENCQKECDMLSSIRNFLLPMLMNGQASIGGLNAN